MKGLATSDPEAACTVGAMKRQDRSGFPMAPFFTIRINPRLKPGVNYEYLSVKGILSNKVMCLD